VKFVNGITDRGKELPIVLANDVLLKETKKYRYLTDM